DILRPVQSQNVRLRMAPQTQNDWLMRLPEACREGGIFQSRPGILGLNRGLQAETIRVATTLSTVWFRIAKSRAKIKVQLAMSNSIHHNRIITVALVEMKLKAVRLGPSD